MVGLHDLPKIKKRSAKRVGRGYGSGKGGHTTGRGHKGQKARGKVALDLEGGQTPLHRRIPKKRGFKRAFRAEVAAINVKKLAPFADGETFTPQKLLKAGLISRIPKGGVKLLGDGNVEKKFVIRDLNLSESARQKIIDAGGRIA
jgi:large subunit ribosomal protein L15